MTYAIDGKCHNAEPGTFNHECGKPATWRGTASTGFVSGFCDECKAEGYEARDIVVWTRLATPSPERLAGAALIALMGLAALSACSPADLGRRAMEMPHPSIDIACADTLIAYPGGFCSLDVPADGGDRLAEWPVSPLTKARVR